MFSPYSKKLIATFLTVIVNAVKEKFKKKEKEPDQLGGVSHYVILLDFCIVHLNFLTFPYVNSIFILGLKNHIEQRNIFASVDVEDTLVGLHWPNIKHQLLHKLDLKLLELSEQLNHHTHIMNMQKRQVLDASRHLRTACQQASDPGNFTKLKCTQLPSGQLVEFCFDLEQVYIAAAHTMQNFISSQSKSGTFLDINKLKCLATKYLL